MKKTLFPIARSLSYRWISGRLRRAIIIAVGFAWAAPVGAATVTESLLFSTTGQSQWSSGPAVNFSTGGSQFLGVPGFMEGFSVGGIEEVCVAFVCADFGAKIGLTVAGRAGLNYDVKINSGSLSVSFPQRVSLSLPDPLAVKIGRPFDITSTLLPATTLSFRPFLQTTGATAQALVGMDLQASLEAVAQVCVAFCYGPRLNVGVNKSQELLALNHNGDGQFRVLGEIQGGVSGSTTVNKGALNLSVQVPTLNSDSRMVGGFDGTLLSSSNRGNVLTLSASLDKIVSDLLGLPPLNAREGDFGYNIVTANAGIAIDVSQQFTFDPNLLGTFNFSSPVIPRTSSGYLPENATSSVMFRVGDTISLRAPGAASLGVAPVFTLDNVTRNETGLKINSDFFVSAGGVSAFGLDLGPLYQEHIPTDLADIPLFGENFRVNVPPIRTNPFNIVFDPLKASIEDDPCLGFGVDLESCLKTGYVRLLPGSNFDVHQIANLYNLVDTSPQGDDCVRLDGLGRLCDHPVAIDLVNELLALEDTIRIGDTSRFVRDGNGGDVYLSGLSLPEFLLDEPLPVPFDTDLGSAQRLTALGFSNDFAAFDIPAGAPFPASVPEPSSLLLLLGGLAGLVGLARRSTGAPPTGPVS